MFLAALIQDYFVWHYTRAWSEFFNIWSNLLWFVTHFFSIPQLLRSWFSPFKRITEDRGETWNAEDLASFVVINILSRIFGAAVRTIIILCGLVVLLATATAGVLIAISWFFAPLLVVVLLGMSISLFLVSV